jgi:hypothetical protein
LAGRLQEHPRTVPLSRDDIAVIGADVIMSKVVLDICRKFGHCAAAFDN